MESAPSNTSTFTASRPNTALPADNLGGHGCFSHIQQAVSTQGIHFHCHVIHDKLDRLFAGQAIAGNNGRGMNLVFHELVGSFEELGSNDNHGGGAVPYLFVLLLGKLHQDLCGRVLDL